MSFCSCLKVGRSAECSIRQFLEGAGFTCRSSEGKQNWDICVEGEGFTFLEIKYDKMAARTGNLAIEYYNPRSAKPSGLAVTLADFWIVVLDKPPSFWMAPVADLRKYFQQCPDYRDVVGVGDGNSTVRLYKQDKILSEVFIRIDGMSGDTLRSLLNAG